MLAAYIKNKHHGSKIQKNIIAQIELGYVREVDWLIEDQDGIYIYNIFEGDLIQISNFMLRRGDSEIGWDDFDEFFNPFENGIKFFNTHHISNYHNIVVLPDLNRSEVEFLCFDDEKMEAMRCFYLFADDLKGK